MKTRLLLLLCVLTLSCRTRHPQEPPLTPTGRPTSYTLSWTLQPMTNYIVTVQMTSTAYGTTNWTTNVTGVNSIIVTPKVKSPSFGAFIAAQAADLSWAYSDTNTAGLWFNLYERPATATNWYSVTNFAGATRSGRCFFYEPSGYVAMTASNSISKTESSSSNLAAWTNKVGQVVPLQVTVR